MCSSVIRQSSIISHALHVHHCPILCLIGLHAINYLQLNGPGVQAVSMMLFCKIIRVPVLSTIIKVRGISSDYA